MLVHLYRTWGADHSSVLVSLGSFSCLLYFASHTNAVEVLKFAKQSNTQYIGSENVFAVNYMGPVLETIGNVLIREVLALCL